MRLGLPGRRHSEPRPSLALFASLLVALFLLGTILVLSVLFFVVQFSANFWGIAFVSAYLSPVRWCIQRIASLASVFGAIGTYVVRRRAWPVLQKMALGLEGYRFGLPQVGQHPFCAGDDVTRYEDMPKGAEERALSMRSVWIAHHLGDVSQTFTKLAINAADVSVLLRTIEADQSLVHAAYYTDDECITRIADWIADTASCKEA